MSGPHGLPPQRPLDLELLPADLSALDPELAEFVRIGRDITNMPHTPVAMMHWKFDLLLAELDGLVKVAEHRGISAGDLVRTIRGLHTKASKLQSIPIDRPALDQRWHVRFGWRDRLALLWQSRLQVRARGAAPDRLEYWLPGKKPRRLLTAREPVARATLDEPRPPEFDAAGQVRKPSDG